MRSIVVRLDDRAFLALVRLAAAHRLTVEGGAVLAVHRGLGLGEPVTSAERELGSRMAARLDGQMREVLGDGR